MTFRVIRGPIQPGVYFPTAGCWEIEARAGREELRLVVLVKAGASKLPVKAICDRSRSPSGEPSRVATVVRETRGRGIGFERWVFPAESR